MQATSIPSWRDQAAVPLPTGAAPVVAVSANQPVAVASAPGACVANSANACVQSAPEVGDAACWGTGRVPDDALLMRVRSGDAQAAAAFVSCFHRRVYRLILGVVQHVDDADELAQDACLKALLHLGQFRGDAGGLTAWVLRIASNTAISHLRRQVHRKSLSLDHPAACGDADEPTAPMRESVASRDPSPVARSRQAERAAAVRAALSDLDEISRTALVLCDVESLDYQQIADVLGLALGTVKSRIHRARHALRELLLQRGVLEAGEVT